jgi:hypothetical protein
MSIDRTEFQVTWLIRQQPVDGAHGYHTASGSHTFQRQVVMDSSFRAGRSRRQGHVHCEDVLGLKAKIDG